MTYEEVCRTFGKDGSRKNTVMARCPCHNDKEESLSISRGNGGKTLIHCFAGCNTKDIVEAAGLKMQDLYQEDEQQRDRSMAAGHRKTVAEFANYKGNKFVDRYDYYNRNGYAFTKIRAERPTGGKTFSTIIADDSLEYVKEPKLPQGKTQADYCAVFPKGAIKYAEEPKEAVFIVEGEKDAKNAVRDGLRAVTVGAAGNWTKGHAEYFKGLKVVVVPDNDPPGIKCALQEVKDLNGIAASVRVIQWPDGFREKGDYSDYVEGFESREEGVKAFLELVDKTTDAESFIKEAEQSIADLKMKTSIDKGNESARKIENEDASGLRERLKELKPEEKYLTDDKGYARLFSDLFPECRASRDSRGRDWYFYDGKCWIVDTGGLEARERCKDMADALYLYAADMQREAFDIFRDSKNPKVQQAASYFKDVQTLGQLKKRQNIITDAISIQPISRGNLDTKWRYFNCKNGVYDLIQDKLIEHSPDLMLSKVSNVIYDPAAKSERFERFIDEIMKGDMKKAAFLQRAFGYSLLGNPKEETSFILYGATTRNGKSTLCETILYLFGDYGMSTKPETLATKNNKDSRSPSEDIARLAGARFVNVPELNRKMILDEAQLKTLTGRDSITARKLNENSFEYIPQFTVFMNTNSLPIVNDMTVFGSGRINIITFDRHFEPSEQDRDLKDELKKPGNISAIFNWLLAGLRSYRQQSLNPPECVRAATEEYRSDSDKLGRFINDRLVSRPGHNEKAVDIYRYYEEWCNDSGYGVENKGNFFAMLKERGIFAKTGTVKVTKPSGIKNITVTNIVKGYGVRCENFNAITTEWNPFQT